MRKKKNPKQPHGLIGTHRPKEVRDKISKAHKGKPKNYPCYLKGLTGKKTSILQTWKKCFSQC